MDRYTAAALQLNSTPDLTRNLRAVEQGVRAATGRGASLIVLPECSTFLGPEPRLLELLSDIESGGEELFS